VEGMLRACVIHFDETWDNKLVTSGWANFVWS
jgi:hypothetical protein